MERNGTTLPFFTFLRLIFDCKLSWEPDLRCLRVKCERSQTVSEVLSARCWERISDGDAPTLPCKDCGSFVQGCAAASGLSVMDRVQDAGTHRTTGAFWTSHLNSLWNQEISFYQCVIFFFESALQSWQRNSNIQHAAMLVPLPATGTRFSHQVLDLWVYAFKASYSELAYNCLILFPLDFQELHPRFSYTLPTICELLRTREAWHPVTRSAGISVNSSNILTVHTCILKDLLSIGRQALLSYVTARHSDILYRSPATTLSYL
jgi:hypothetical protein